MTTDIFSDRAVGIYFQSHSVQCAFELIMFTVRVITESAPKKGSKKRDLKPENLQKP